MFKRRRFPVDMILVCVRWYCKYGISYRDLAERMQERGVDVDPSTIMRWVHRYAPFGSCITPNSAEVLRQISFKATVQPISAIESELLPFMAAPEAKAAMRRKQYCRNWYRCLRA